MEIAAVPLGLQAPGHDLRPADRVPPSLPVVSRVHDVMQRTKLVLDSNDCDEVMTVMM